VRPQAERFYTAFKGEPACVRPRRRPGGHSGAGAAPVSRLERPAPRSGSRGGEGEGLGGKPFQLVGEWTRYLLGGDPSAQAGVGAGGGWGAWGGTPPASRSSAHGGGEIG